MSKRFKNKEASYLNLPLKVLKYLFLRLVSFRKVLTHENDVTDNISQHISRDYLVEAVPNTIQRPDDTTVTQPSISLNGGITIAAIIKTARATATIAMVILAEEENTNRISIFGLSMEYFVAKIAMQLDDVRRPTSNIYYSKRKSLVIIFFGLSFAVLVFINL